MIVETESGTDGSDAFETGESEQTDGIGSGVMLRLAGANGGSIRTVSACCFGACGRVRRLISAFNEGNGMPPIGRGAVAVTGALDVLAVSVFDDLKKGNLMLFFPVKVS